MRIAVISPHTVKTGKTTLSMLLGLELAKTSKKVCMCHTDPISESTFAYLGLSAFADKTSSPSQIVKMLREGDIDKSSCSDYCKQVNNNFEVFTNISTNFTDDDMQYMLNYIVKDFPHEHVIVDMDTNDMKFNKAIIKNCDVVLLCITQGIKEAIEFKAMREEIAKFTEGKPIVTVVNKYNSSKGTLQELARNMGLKKPNGWLVLHENPWIEWGTNHGKLETVFRLLSKKDPRVIELNAELNKIVVTLLRAKSTKDKKKVGARR